MPTNQFDYQNAFQRDLVSGVHASLVGISRIEVGAHSISEVLAGWVLGGVVNTVALSDSECGNHLCNPL
jgi:hypothetical protein